MFSVLLMLFSVLIFFFLGTCKGKPVSNKAWLELQEQRAVGEVQV